MEIDPKQALKQKKFIRACVYVPLYRNLIEAQLTTLLEAKVKFWGYFIPLTWPIFDVDSPSMREKQRSYDDALLEFARVFKIKGVAKEIKTQKEAPKHHIDILEYICMMRNGCKPPYPRVKEYIVVELVHEDIKALDEMF